jgi:uncharacterized membrane protein
MQDPLEQPAYRNVQMSGCLAMFLLLFLGCILPFMLVDLAQTALTNLHLDRSTAVLVLLGIIFGSVINIPVSRFPLDQEVVVPVFQQFGSWPPLERYQRLRQECVVSVNVGGCVIPVLLAVKLASFIISGGQTAVLVAAVGIVLNSAICYQMVRIVPRIGIALPPFIPVLTALVVTWVGLSGHPREFSAPVAFVIGITGPLIGADLLHWKDFKKIQAGSISIGGAGTFDGIVLSGLLASLLA